MVSIQLHESIAAALRAQASARGLSLEVYLTRLANQDTSGGNAPLSESEVDRMLDELSIDVRPLPADFSRADIYLDHD